MGHAVREIFVRALAAVLAHEPAAGAVSPRGRAIGPPRPTFPVACRALRIIRRLGPGREAEPSWCTVQPGRSAKRVRDLVQRRMQGAAHTRKRKRGVLTVYVDQWNLLHVAHKKARREGERLGIRVIGAVLCMKVF